MFLGLYFLIKSFWYMTKKSTQIFKYLENGKSFWGEIKVIFHHFKKIFSCQKLSQTWEESVAWNDKSKQSNNLITDRIFYAQGIIILNMSSLFILIIKDLKNRWKHWAILINNRVKLINIARQFTKALLAVLFLRSCCYKGPGTRIHFFEIFLKFN